MCSMFDVPPPSVHPADPGADVRSSLVAKPVAVLKQKHGKDHNNSNDHEDSNDHILYSNLI